MKGLVTEWLRNQHPGIELSDELLDRSELALDPMFRSKYPKLLAFPLPLPEADVRLVHDGFDLRLMYSESDVSSIPTSGTNLVIVADVKGVLYFRIFDADGKVVVDTDETRLTTQAGPIADLRRQLDSVRPPHELTRSEKDRVVTAVTSIVGHARHDTDLPLTLQVKICLMDSGCGLCDVSLAVKGFDLRLMYSESDVSSIPTSGTNLVIVADVKGVLYFRIFDADGKVVVDTDETRLTTQAGPIADLRRQLDSVWPPHELTCSEKDRVVTAVTSIVGHTRQVSFKQLFDLLKLANEQHGEKYQIKLGSSTETVYGLFLRSLHDFLDSLGFDLRLMSSLNDVSGIPIEGKNLIIVATVKNVLHFRIFDGDGKVVVDTDEKRVTVQARQIEDLREQLKSLWPPHKLTWNDKNRIITVVTSIVDHTHSLKEATVPPGGDQNEKQLVQWDEVRKGKSWGRQYYKVAWLDFGLADFSKEREYQQPYLVIELLANEELYSEFFLANPDEVDASSIRQKRLRISKELSSMLFREVIFENIDYLDPTFPGWADLTRGEMSVTTNLNLNSQLFLTVHYRSTLLVSNAGLPEGRNPFRFIGPSALTMLCFVRLRWYALVTINGLLDDLLRKVACLPADEAWSTEVNRITKDIMKWRMRLGHFLEDPTVYHWGGGSLPQAFKIAQQAFSLERLERGALQKFAVIDRAIADFVRSRSIEALQ